MSLFQTEFERMLDKATGDELLDPDWGLNTDLCDLVRQKETKPIVALTAVKRKISPKNPHKTLLALTVLEMLLGNCGTIFVAEFCASPTIKSLNEWVMPGFFNETISQRILAIIQNTAIGFKGEPSIVALEQLYQSLKFAGYSFPECTVKESMYRVNEAPEWADADICFSCRTSFTVITRKHHCRHCGQVFCAACSSKNQPIPKFGLEKPVRVCDRCSDILTGGSSASAPTPVTTQRQSVTATQQTGPIIDESREEDELAQAIRESLKLAEQEKERNRKYESYSSPPAASPAPAVTATPVNQYPSSDIQVESSGGIYGGGNQSLYNNTSTPPQSSSSPAPTHNASRKSTGNTSTTAPKEVEEVDPIESFLQRLRPTLQLFSKKLQTAQQTNRNVSLDNTIKSLHQSTIALQPQLLDMVESTESRKLQLSELSHKIETIVSIRNSIIETKRKQKEEQELLQRIQLEQKLKFIQQQELQMSQPPNHQYQYGPPPSQYAPPPGPASYTPGYMLPRETQTPSPPPNMHYSANAPPGSYGQHQAHYQQMSQPPQQMQFNGPPPENAPGHHHSMSQPPPQPMQFNSGLPNSESGSSMGSTNNPAPPSAHIPYQQPQHPIQPSSSAPQFPNNNTPPQQQTYMNNSSMPGQPPMQQPQHHQQQQPPMQQQQQPIPQQPTIQQPPMQQQQQQPPMQQQQPPMQQQQPPPPMQQQQQPLQPQPIQPQQFQPPPQQQQPAEPAPAPAPAPVEQLISFD